MTKSDPSVAIGVGIDLLEILACPRCKGGLTHSKSPQSLDCLECKLRYLIRDGIPMLLVEEAQPL